MDIEATDTRVAAHDSRSYKLDATAIEALSAGIGLGKLVNKQKHKPAPARKRVTATTAPPAHKKRTTTKVRFRFMRSMLAWCCDLLIISASLLAATAAAHYATTNMLPAPADILFALRERFAAHEVAIASAALLSAYFILFRLLTGFTLGEVLFGARQR